MLSFIKGELHRDTAKKENCNEKGTIKKQPLRLPVLISAFYVLVFE